MLGINKPPVAIEHIEKAIIEKAFEEGYISANPVKSRKAESVAVVGSGPAGLAAARPGAGADGRLDGPDRPSSGR